MSNNNQDTPSPFPPPTNPNGTTNQAAQQATHQPSQKQSQPDQTQSRSYTVTQAENYFTAGNFSKQINEFVGNGSRKTGFQNLDDQQPLYPGLYCIGAISSLGKTTFVHQMADQIAEAGDFVLYISLEQSHFELFSKSIARGFFKQNRAEQEANGGKISTYPTPSSIDIRRGYGSGYQTELQEQIDKYVASVKNRMTIIDGSFSMTIENIIELIEEVIEIGNGVKPVVFIDYLQIIAPTLVGGRPMDTKTSIDHIVHSLKVIQSKHDLVIITVSSLNRENYGTTIGFEAFKESGGIEYTADVIWGLQLSLLSDPDFQKMKPPERKEELLKAKAENPRNIEFVCLKNRYGISSFTTHFDYYPASDTFVPVMPSPIPDIYYV